MGNEHDVIRYTKQFLSDLLMEQTSLAGMLQVLDVVESHVKAVRAAMVSAFGVENDNGQTH